MSIINLLQEKLEEFRAKQLGHFFFRAFVPITNSIEGQNIHTLPGVNPSILEIRKRLNGLYFIQLYQSVLKFEKASMGNSSALRKLPAWHDQLNTPHDGDYSTYQHGKHRTFAPSSENSTTQHHLQEVTKNANAGVKLRLKAGQPKAVSGLSEQFLLTFTQNTVVNQHSHFSKINRFSVWVLAAVELHFFFALPRRSFFPWSFSCNWLQLKLRSPQLQFKHEKGHPINSTIINSPDSKAEAA